MQERVALSLLTLLLLACPVASADTTATVLSTIRSIHGSDSLENKPKLEKWEDGSASLPQAIYSEYDDIYKDIRHPVLKTAIHESLAGKLISDKVLRQLNNQFYYDSINQGLYLQSNLAFKLAETQAAKAFEQRTIGFSKKRIVNRYGKPFVQFGEQNPWTPKDQSRSYFVYELGYCNTLIKLTFVGEKCVESKIDNNGEYVRTMFNWYTTERTNWIGKSEDNVRAIKGLPTSIVENTTAKKLLYPVTRNSNADYEIKNGICTNSGINILAGWRIKPGSIQQSSSLAPTQMMIPANTTLSLMEQRRRASNKSLLETEGHFSKVAWLNGLKPKASTNGGMYMDRVDEFRKFLKDYNLIGMTEESVVEKLGQPDQQSLPYSYGYAIYAAPIDSGATLFLDCENGKVKRWRLSSVGKDGPWIDTDVYWTGLSSYVSTDGTLLQYLPKTKQFTEQQTKSTPSQESLTRTETKSN
jgi:hypothetical protein